MSTEVLGYVVRCQADAAADDVVDGVSEGRAAAHYAHQRDGGTPTEGEFISFISIMLLSSVCLIWS